MELGPEPEGNMCTIGAAVRVCDVDADDSCSLGFAKEALKPLELVTWPTPMNPMLTPFQKQTYPITRLSIYVFTPSVTWLTPINPMRIPFKNQTDPISQLSIYVFTPSVILLIHMNPMLIPFKKQTNPTNPINPDVKPAQKAD